MKSCLGVTMVTALIVVCMLASISRADSLASFVQEFCAECHSRENAERIDVSRLSEQPIGAHRDEWERVLRMLATRRMPPSGATLPASEQYAAAIAAISDPLNREAQAHPRPGRTESLRRMTRMEYHHAIRDLLSLDVDVTRWFPADELSHGFDNVTVTELTPALLSRYLTAAQSISRMAMGRPTSTAEVSTFRVRPDVTQDVPIDGLPIGTRGGMVIPFTFTHDGEYDIQVHLMRDRNEEIEGLREPHALEVLVDREQRHVWAIAPPSPGVSDRSVDAHLTARLRMTAGPHDVGVTFVDQSAALLETQRQPYHVHFNYYRHPRLGPAVYQVSITGPINGGSAGDSPSRRQILGDQRPTSPDDEEQHARSLLARLARRAYRRANEEDDLASLWNAYRTARQTTDYEGGMEAALSALLVSPQFLFRIERDPPGMAPGEAYRIRDEELASRLSFFLWSSIPDDELLQLAEQDKLHGEPLLAHQVKRMLQDEKSRALVENFAAQWLHLRNLDAATPDMRLFPDFDDNLRQAFRRETEQHLLRLIQEDRSVLDLLHTDETFLNERLAAHYGIPHVYGNRMRRVSLVDGSGSLRGGLLRQGSILTVTSYATRTSPVLRGKWILETLLASPPPPPPANVPALDDNRVSASLPVRARLAQHRADPNCAGCHQLIDRVGFGLEHYNAIGQWRDREEGEPVDDAGCLPGERTFANVAGLEQQLLAEPEPFAYALAEKLLVYALGRGIEPFDGPALRHIVREARAENYRFSAFVLAVVRSQPFQMRNAE